MDTKEPKYVSGQEQKFVGRALLDWLNEYPDLPEHVGEIESEYVGTTSGMGLYATTAPYKTQEYISGAYNAQYQFALLYRTAPESSDARLSAAEFLSNIAEWVEQREDLPDLGAGKQAISIGRTSPATMLGRYDDGSEDYQILMAFDYAVRP